MVVGRSGGLPPPVAPAPHAPVTSATTLLFLKNLLFLRMHKFGSHQLNQTEECRKMLQFSLGMQKRSGLMNCPDTVQCTMRGVAAGGLPQHGSTC